jgi:hypothetical protein
MEKETIKRIFDFLEEKEEVMPKNNLRWNLLFNKPLTKDELNIKDDLNLMYSSIESLPEGLKVGGDLSLRGCKHLRSLPKGLIVKGYLFLINSSLKKYTDEQLREMIEPDGFINGKIIR